MQRGDDGLHSPQTMSAASCSFLSFASITSKIIGCVLLQAGHQTRGEAPLQVAGYGGIACHVERPVDSNQAITGSLTKTPPEGMAGGALASAEYLGAGDRDLPNSYRDNSLGGISFLPERPSQLTSAGTCRKKSPGQAGAVQE
jgi:hypothetical protein